MSRQPYVPPRGTGRARALLMLAVLAGLFAMHGLGPRAAVAAPHEKPVPHTAHAPTAAHGPSQPASGHTHQRATAAQAPVHHGTSAEPAPARDRTSAASVPVHEAGCDGPDHGGDHARHADGTCAAPGAGTGPVITAPAPAPFDAPPVAHAHGLSVVADTGGGRAPPSLSELQLLRQ